MRIKPVLLQNNFLKINQVSQLNTLTVRKKRFKSISMRKFDASFAGTSTTEVNIDGEFDLEYKQSDRNLPCHFLESTVLPNSNGQLVYPPNGNCMQFSNLH